MRYETDSENVQPTPPPTPNEGDDHIVLALTPAAAVEVAAVVVGWDVFVFWATWILVPLMLLTLVTSLLSGLFPGCDLLRSDNGEEDWARPPTLPPRCRPRSPPSGSKASWIPSTIPPSLEACRGTLRRSPGHMVNPGSTHRRTIARLLLRRRGAFRRFRRPGCRWIHLGPIRRRRDRRRGVGGRIPSTRCRDVIASLRRSASYRGARHYLKEVILAHPVGLWRPAAEHYITSPK